MTTAIDTNILVALWDRDEALSAAAQSALDAAQQRGSLVVAAPVHAELMAARGRDEAFLDSFLQNTGIQVDWNVVEGDWRAAGRAFQSYTGRRSKHREPGSRRILADFLIGAHAWRRGYRLLTLDAGLYQAAFPHLTIARLRIRPRYLPEQLYCARSNIP